MAVRRRVRIREVDFGYGISFALLDVDDDNRVGRYARLSAVEWVPYNQLTFVPHEASIDLDPGAAQMMIDDLWRAGFRPRDAQAGDAVLQAKNDHIRDLQLSTATLHAVVQSALVKS